MGSRKDKLLESYESIVEKKLLSKKLYLMYAVVVIILLLFFSRIWNQQISSILFSVNPIYLILACTVYGTALIIRGYRFHVLVSTIKKVNLGKMLSIQIFSQVLTIYVSSLAEGVKALPLKVSEKIPIKRGIKVFAVEKTLDLFVNLVILVLAVPYLSNFFPETADLLFKTSMLGLGVITIAGVYFIHKRYRKILTLERALKIFGTSFGIAVVKATGIYLTFLAIGAHPPYYMVFAIYAILTIIPFLVILPFGLGVKEPLIVLVSQYSIGLSSSGAFAILINVVLMLTYTVMALGSFAVRKS